MRTIIVFTLICILTGLASCDPMYRLVVLNTSGTDVKMRVVYNQPDAQWRQRFLDTSENRSVRRHYSSGSHPVYNNQFYIVFYDRSDKHCSKGVKRAIARQTLFDSLCNCVSLILPASEHMVLEGGLGVGPRDQEIIFDETNTVDVLNSKRVWKKSSFWLGGDYVVHTLLDQWQ